jgi:hypothetical protein
MHTTEIFDPNKNIFRKILTQRKIYAKITLSNDDRLIENEITRRNKPEEKGNQVKK